MQHSRMIRTTVRRSLSLEGFVRSDPTLKRLAADCGQTPEDYIASEFVAESEPGEQYPDWVVRQAKAVLETRLMADDCRDLPGGHRHTASRVTQVELDTSDRLWLLNTFARRADVRDAWNEAQARVWARAA